MEEFDTLNLLNSLKYIEEQIKIRDAQWQSFVDQLRTKRDEAMRIANEWHEHYDRIKADRDRLSIENIQMRYELLRTGRAAKS